jgi:hypothetical protein
LDRERDESQLKISAGALRALQECVKKHALWEPADIIRSLDGEAIKEALSAFLAKKCRAVKSHPKQERPLNGSRFLSA